GQMPTRFETPRPTGAGVATAPLPTPREKEIKMAEQSALQRTPPPLAQSAYVRALQPTWSAATRNALAQAASPREWNLLFLASPEFMHG
ncbi:MAG: DUF1800 domain-containing protein, partial [Acidovorax sp.]|nr:DUF1800 domain-containing protein [Acidovorax sp.]